MSDWWCCQSALALQLTQNTQKHNNSQQFNIHKITKIQEHNTSHVKNPKILLQRSFTGHMQCPCWLTYSRTHAHARAFNNPFSGTTQVSRYQKGKTNLDFTEARDTEWQWHQLGHIQVCTALQTDNHASTPPLPFFYRPDALPAAQPTASKHWRQKHKPYYWHVYVVVT